jgi:DNA-binding transcriptional MerR regulator
MDKKDAAWELYKSGYQGNQIAKIFGVSAQTIVTWKKEGKWDSRMASQKELWESNAQHIQELIAYQLRTIKANVSEWEDKGTRTLIGKGEIDALSKLYATIKTKETTWGNYIRVCKELMEFLAAQDLDLSKKLADKIDEFLNHVRTDING